MAISFVGSATNSALNGNNVTVTLPAGWAAGDFAVLAYTIGSADDRAMSATAGWTEETELYQTSASSMTNFAVYTRVLQSGDANPTVTGSGLAADAVTAVLEVYRGVDTTTPLDVAVVTASNSGDAQPDAAATTPSSSGAWIVVCGGGAYSAVSDFTNPGDLSSTAGHFATVSRADTHDSATGIGIKTNWVSGSFNPAKWGGGSASLGSWAAATLVLRPAASLTHYSMPADVGSYTLTGTAATLTYAEALDALTWASGGTVAADSPDGTSVGFVAGRTASSTLTVISSTAL